MDASKEAASKTIEPLTVHNLLPCDLFLEIKVAGEIQKARLESGGVCPFTSMPNTHTY